MEAIHVKTVDPISQDLLRAVAAKGVELGWERFEKLQPMDGFLRLGLSCPFGCLEGPCRVDPFGRGAAAGVCGLGRDGMAAATLLRVALNGVMEALAGAEAPAEVAAEIVAASAVLARPGNDAAGMVKRAIRLGGLALDLAPAGPDIDSAPVEAGYGTIAAKGAVAFCGAPDAALVDAVAEQACAVALGDWIVTGRGVLPLACTSGEAELAVAAGLVDAVVLGAGASAAIAGACAATGVPCFDDTVSAPEILAAAAKARARRPAAAPDDMPRGSGTIVLSPAALAKDAGRGKLAVFAGSDVVHQPLGWIATEVAPTLAGDGACIAAWGDAATWLIKAGQGAEGGVGVRALCPQGGARTVLDSGARIAGVCFVGLKACRDLAVALGLAARGVRVCVATPIPVWGSAAVREILAAEIKAQGGELAHFDHPATADEVLKWFTAS